MSVGEALASPTSLSGSRRRPTLPGRCQPSTISAKRLNFCVRYGNRWIPLAIITGNLSVCSPSLSRSSLMSLDFRLLTSVPRVLLRLFSHTFTTAQPRVPQYEFLLFASSFFSLPRFSPLPRSLPLTSPLRSFASAPRCSFLRLSPRPISIIKLHTLPHFHR